MRIDKFSKNVIGLGKDEDIKETSGYDILKISPVRKLIMWKAFPYIFQILMLAVFILLAVIGWQVFPKDGYNTKMFAKNNIVTHLVWALWWPVMIWTTVILGRVWCTVCPLEFVSNISERLGKFLGIKQKSLPKWIRGGAIIVFLYAVIQLLVSGAQLHRMPAYTSFFLFGLLSMSFLVGVFFKDRAFCRGFCPAGMLLNAYGRGGMLAVRPGSSQSCSDCKEKDCLTAVNRSKPDKRSCPSLLNPSRLNSGSECLICGQCIKSCEPDNMQLIIRKPFDKKDSREMKAGWPLTIFVMLVSGFVTSELATEWKAANKIFTAVPEFLTKISGIPGISGYIEGIWTIMIFPVFLWLLLGLITKVLKGADSITDAWRKLALPLVIIISAGHMTKAVAKFVSWVGHLPLAINDPLGYAATDSIAAGLLKSPAPAAGSAAVGIAGILILAAAFFFSVREDKIIDAEKAGRRFIPKLLMFLLYGIIIAGIGLK